MTGAGPTATARVGSLSRREWRRLKRLGFSDPQLAYLLGSDEATVRATRSGLGVVPTFKTVDTCGAEFAADTPYHYSTYEDEEEVRPSERLRVIILGSGPNRIGQGIEFDYCCVHAAMALRAAGYETVMINCNPETVSTDYDTSDRLYFEPLSAEDVLNVIDAEQRASVGEGRVVGVVVSLGGQTPLKLAGVLPESLVLGHAGRLDRPGRGPRALERALRPSRHRAAGRRHREQRRGGPGDRRPRSGSRCSSDRATCSAAAPWRSSMTRTGCHGS